MKKTMWILVCLFIAVLPLYAGTGQDIVEAGFFKIYDPGVGEDKPWYINDHCFIFGPDNKWHLFGITREEPARPMEEDQFAHATSDILTQYPWTKKPFALTTSAKHGEDHLWAPHVIENDDIYYMFYCGGGVDGKHTEYQINLATSKDLYNWQRHPENPLFIDGFDARDPMILRHDGKWLMYYTCTSKPEGGNYIVGLRTSDDLIHWSERETAFKDPAVGSIGGPTESPFVLRRGKYFYLFIGPRGGYIGTDIFQSTTPYQWELDDLVGHVHSHAAEVIRDLDGKWYVSACGWGQNGVYLAPMIFRDGQDENDTSLPIPEKK